MVSFNGDESRGEDYETFEFKRDDKSFSFCKTAHKPYDLVVTAAMLVIKRHWDNHALRISGDGKANGFIEGFKFAAEVLGWDKDVEIPYDNTHTVIKHDGLFTYPQE